MLKDEAMTAGLLTKSEADTLVSWHITKWLGGNKKNTVPWNKGKKYTGNKVTHVVRG